jgi:uncharacterized membrane protein YeaQ/YmgE (transglycosylase-associated protein family)
LRSQESGQQPMTSLADPLVVFVMVVLIGIVAGLLAQRFFRSSWISQQIAGRHRGTVTSALVGIAGSFLGFHLAAISKLAGSGIASLVAAAIGAVVVLWGWKALKLVSVAHRRRLSLTMTRTRSRQNLSSSGKGR